MKTKPQIKETDAMQLRIGRTFQMPLSVFVAATNAATSKNLTVSKWVENVITEKLGIKTEQQ